MLREGRLEVAAEQDGFALYRRTADGDMEFVALVKSVMLEPMRSLIISADRAVEGPLEAPALARFGRYRKVAGKNPATLQE